MRKLENSPFRRRRCENMKRNFISILAALMLMGLLGLAEMSLAVESMWTKKADMPTPRFGLSASAVDGKIYVIGGWGKAGKMSTVEEYDPTTDTWTTKTDMPTARKGMATCVVNGKIYAFSGSSVVANAGGNGLLIAAEEYDPAADIWTKKEDIPTARFGASAVAVNGKIYVIGGWGVGDHTSVVEMYDPVTDTWEKRANMPRGLGNMGSASVGGKIYVFGGSSLAGPVSTTYEYDPAADKWTQKADMASSKMLLPASALDGKIYLIGGNVAGGGTTASVLVYDPAEDAWTDGTEIPTARGSLAAAVVDGKIYAIGGHTGVTWGNMGTVYATVEEYAPEDLGPTDASAVSPQGKKPLTWGEIKQR
jgi:N-acetylneuraminic acid mutarotase